MSKLMNPSAGRNKVHILKVLQKHFCLKKPGQQLLEISSGTGEHCALFAEHFPNVTFQPSEHDGSMFGSIGAHAAEVPFGNVRAPIAIDASSDWAEWNLHTDRFDYMININMMHITPFECTLGLFRNAGKLLKPEGKMITYGPYAYKGVIEEESNRSFDRSLRRQNSGWGLRDYDELIGIAKKHRLELIDVCDMPANNKCLVWQKLL